MKECSNNNKLMHSVHLPISLHMSGPRPSQCQSSLYTHQSSPSATPLPELVDGCTTVLLLSNCAPPCGVVKTDAL